MMMVHSHKRLRAPSDVFLHYKHVHAYKKRKMQHWTTTVGQCLFKARNECNETVRSVLEPAYYDVAEAATDCSEVEDGIWVPSP